jgi:hypothetical protein
MEFMLLHSGLQLFQLLVLKQSWLQLWFLGKVGFNCWLLGRVNKANNFTFHVGFTWPLYSYCSMFISRFMDIILSCWLHKIILGSSLSFCEVVVMLINSTAVLYLPHWLPYTTPFDCPPSSFDMSRSDSVVYYLLGLFGLSIALGCKGHIHVVLNLVLMFCLDSDWLSALSTQPANVTLSSFQWLFLNMFSYLSF